MVIRLIVVRYPGSDTPWVVGAWDEWTIDENPSGWQEVWDG